MGFHFCAKIAKRAFSADEYEASQGRKRPFCSGPSVPFPAARRAQVLLQTPSAELGMSVPVPLPDRGPTAWKDKAISNYCARKSRSVLGDAVLSKLIPTPTTAFITSSLSSLTIPLPLFLAMKMPRFLLSPCVSAALGPYAGRARQARFGLVKRKRMTKSGTTSVEESFEVSAFRGTSVCSSFLNRFVYREPVCMGFSDWISLISPDWVSLIGSRQA